LENRVLFLALIFLLTVIFSISSKLISLNIFK
jgi:hypothetical protein